MCSRLQCSLAYKRNGQRQSTFAIINTILRSVSPYVHAQFCLPSIYSRLQCTAHVYILSQHVISLSHITQCSQTSSFNYDKKMPFGILFDCHTAGHKYSIVVNWQYMVTERCVYRTWQCHTTHRSATKGAATCRSKLLTWHFYGTCPHFNLCPGAQRLILVFVRDLGEIIQP